MITDGQSKPLKAVSLECRSKSWYRDPSSFLSTDEDGPKFIRIQFYEYDYCPLFGDEWWKGNWWCRKKHPANYWPPMNVNDLKRRLR